MAQKFLFNTEFLVDEPAPEEAVVEPAEIVAPPEPTFDAADLARARADGLTEGHAAGLAEGRTETERLVAQAMAVIAERLGVIGETVRGHQDAVTRDATAVATAIIRKVAPDLIRRGALEAIEAAIADCLPGLAEEPRIVVRVHDDLLDPIQGRIQPIADGGGFVGDVVVIPDPTLEPSDCTVEWADGGIRHDPSRVWRDIEDILRAHLEPQDADVAPPTPAAPPTEPAPMPEAASVADGKN